MKLVGATNWFIRWPFVIEGIICGLMGAVLSVGAAVGREGGRRGPVDRGRRQRPHARRGHTIGFPTLGLILIAAGALVGALGSGITLRRFLKV